MFVPLLRLGFRRAEGWKKRVLMGGLKGGIMPVFWEAVSSRRYSKRESFGLLRMEELEYIHSVYWGVANTGTQLSFGFGESRT